MSKKDAKTLHSLQWFTKRIGKRVYPESWGCDCWSCKDSQENGILISNMSIALNLHMHAQDIPVIYRDKKQNDNKKDGEVRKEES